MAVNSSIVTFNFNDYDAHHSHFYAPSISYVMVTDNTSRDDGDWTIKYPERIANLSPWEKSLYVRYHPFDFVESDIAIVIDGSMCIGENVTRLVNWFENSDYDVAIPLSHHPECKERISRWRNQGRISDAETRILNHYLKANQSFNFRGCLSGAVRLLRKTPDVIDWLNYTWNTLYTLGNDNTPIRLDEVVSTITLCEKFQQLNVAPLATSIMDGEVFQYTDHKTGLPVHLETEDKCYYNNDLVAPIHIDKEYTRAYDCKTEIMCLTKYLNPDSLREWIEHHLGIGFEHIHIFDNDSPYECEHICNEYGSKVSYELIRGYARHYAIYDDYVNSDRCKSEWILPLDDDEYLELNTDVCKDVNECIDWYTTKFNYDHMFAIRWKHLFPKKFHSDCVGPILDYCTEENRMLATQFQPMGDRGVKTFVHRYGRIHYEERAENPSGGHVPKHSVSKGARLFNGEKITTCSCSHIPKEPNEPARVIHCRYKGYSWYKAKYLDNTSPTYCYGNCDAVPYVKKYNFNDVLETLP